MIFQKIVNRFKYNKKRKKTENEYYVIDGFTLNIGAGHALPNYQKSFQMYDRFVPFLGGMADEVGKDKWILDIGSNVGDTVAAIIKHTHNNVICVEPTEKFYKLCCENINGLGEPFSERIKVVNAYISNDPYEKFISKVNAGTAVKIKSENHEEAITLTVPELINQFGLKPNDISLIKVDTDGFDSDCIVSCGHILHDTSILLYWENEIDEKEHYEKYCNMMHYLEANEYYLFYIFDNYGNYLLKTDLTGMRSINDYLERIRCGFSARSFYYVDVLSCKIEHQNLCDRVINTYLRNYI